MHLGRKTGLGPQLYNVGGFFLFVFVCVFFNEKLNLHRYLFLTLFIFFISQIILYIFPFFMCMHICSVILKQTPNGD